MYEILRKNWDKSKYFLLSGVIVVFFLLVTVVYKNEDQIKLKSQNYQDSYELTDLKIFKDYLFDQIKLTSKVQYPFAVVLSCMDSHVPLEMIFD